MTPEQRPKLIAWLATWIRNNPRQAVKPHGFWHPAWPELIRYQKREFGHFSHSVLGDGINPAPALTAENPGITRTQFGELWAAASSEVKDE